MKVQNLKFWLIGGFAFFVFWSAWQVIEGNYGITTRISISSKGTQGDNISWYSDISGDGRYIVFSSYASNLVTDDTNNFEDVFIHDRVTGVTTRVSISSSGEQANQSSDQPKVSMNGRYVIFTSQASNLVQGDNNGEWDLFVHDLQTGETVRASVASDGSQSEEGTFFNVAISPDGTVVAFPNSSANLVSDDSNDSLDIFVHNLQTGETRRVSVASDGMEANNHSAWPWLSYNGQMIAFQSMASNLVAGDNNNYCDSNYNGEYGDNCQDIFVHDQTTGATVRVSVASDGTEGNDASWNPSISVDGRFVTFLSLASNLVEGDDNYLCDNDADGENDNNCPDIFVHDLQTGTTERVSVSSFGIQADGGSLEPVISADGRYIAFESWATNLVSGDTNNKSDIFIHDRQTGETRRVSVSTGGAQSFWGAAHPALSADGRFIAFDSFSGLVPGDTNNQIDVFVHDWLPPYQLYFPVVSRPSE